MEENKLFRLILKYLIEKCAYSLALYEEQGDKCLYLEYRNIYNLNALIEECSKNGIELGELDLSVKVSEMYNMARSFKCALMKMNGLVDNEYFFIGEILHLNLKNGEYVDIAKINKDSWWITDASAKYSDLCASYVKFDKSIGTDTTLICGSINLEIDSVSYLVSTEIFRHLDMILFPSYYYMGIPDSFSLEETLLVPLYNEIKKSIQVNKMEFSAWRIIAEKAYKNGMDSKTIWCLSNAVFRNYKRMFLWS